MHGLNRRLNAALRRYGFVTKEIIPDYLGIKAEYMEMELI